MPDFRPFRSKFLPPQLAIKPEMSDGPVRILIDYYVDPEDYNAFVQAIHELKMCGCAMARCAGASFKTRMIPVVSLSPSLWSPGLTTFASGSASLHRTGPRDRVLSLHRGEEPPRITHTIYAKERADCRYQR